MINERIRFPQVRVIDDQNAQLGVMGTREALELARDRDLDLIVVAPQAQPPVCRIMDYGKFKYEKSKREKEAHKKGAQTEMKMVRLKPVTSEHDRGVLIKHSDRFLRAGHKVRVICRFQGRQNAHPEIGRAQLQTVADELAAIATVEGAVIKQGRDMIMNLTPRPGVKPLPKTSKEGDEAAIAATVGGTEAVHDPDADAEFEAIQQVIMGDDEDDVEDEGIDAAAIVVDITSDDGTTDGAAVALPDEPGHGT
jgi:translation initiation factor IF-3